MKVGRGGAIPRHFPDSVGHDFEHAELCLFTRRTGVCALQQKTRWNAAGFLGAQPKLREAG
jgi:hypothetical protein